MAVANLHARAADADGLADWNSFRTVALAHSARAGSEAAEHFRRALVLAPLAFLRCAHVPAQDTRRHPRRTQAIAQALQWADDGLDLRFPWHRGCRVHVEPQLFRGVVYDSSCRAQRDTIAVGLLCLRSARAWPQCEVAPRHGVVLCGRRLGGQTHAPNINGQENGRRSYKHERGLPRSAPSLAANSGTSTVAPIVAECIIAALAPGPLSAWRAWTVYPVGNARTVHPGARRGVAERRLNGPSSALCGPQWPLMISSSPAPPDDVSSAH